MSGMHATGCPICGYDNTDMTLVAQLGHVQTEHSWWQRYRLYRQTRTPLKDLLINRKYSDGGRAFLSRLQSRDEMVLDIWCAVCGWRFTAGDFYVPLPGEWGYWVHSMSCGRNPGHGPDETPRRPTHERLADGTIRRVCTCRRMDVTGLSDAEPVSVLGPVNPQCGAHGSDREVRP